MPLILDRFLKTNIFFSSNVPANVARNIGKTFGFTITNNLGRYLGLPFLLSRVTKNTYQEIVDKVEKGCQIGMHHTSL